MAASDVTIRDLLALARAGDAEALDRLFALCRNYLAVVAQAQLESWLRAKVDASDLVQQTLLEAYRDFTHFQGGTQGEWLAWLRRILSRNAIDCARRFHDAAALARPHEVPLMVPGSSANGVPDPADSGESPSQHLLRKEREILVADALARLSPDHREVIQLRNLQRLDFAEVARRMNRSRPAVQMLWVRALANLQELLAAE
jgi:RNA polymerase sigma-70 factor (ECF subfamily)